jgi:hypothetical protein
MLIEYLPEVIQGVREYKALFGHGEQPEIDNVWKAIDDAFDDQFIASATISGVKRWESILGLHPKGTDTLQNRKFRILSRLNEKLPYTMPMLENMLETLCGAGNYETDLDHAAYSLNVLVGLASNSNIEDIRRLLDKVCPANIMITLDMKYNRHIDFRPFTHTEMAAKTHYQLRNEVT